MKLWEKGYALQKKVEEYTVGDDYLLDRRLVLYDCRASQAHARTLHAAGILTKQELMMLENGLGEIMRLAEQGKFSIKPEDEDCHTAIEDHLTRHCGTAGRKLHTARSRNDQVLTALRLYEKDELVTIKKLLLAWIDAADAFSELYGKIVFPGYTHTRKAMPSTIGMWIRAFQDAFQDDIVLLKQTLALIDQSPLGTAAGYGIPTIKIDRKFSADQLSFAKVLENPIYAQLSRGKFEAHILHVLTGISLTLNRFASDCIIFSSTEFGYLQLAKEICSGSSIMPQKLNPDVFEIMRGSYHSVSAESQKMQNLTANLMSGYHRDIQLSKAPLFSAIDRTKKSIDIATICLAYMSIDAQACNKACSKEIYATEEAYRLVEQGMPFREAYRKVAEKYS